MLKPPKYKKITEKDGDLQIIDHSARFEVGPAIERKSSKRSVEATFWYQPGSRRDIEYRVGDVSLRALIIDAHPSGNDSPHTEVRWDSTLSPREFLKAILKIEPPRQKRWQYVDFGEDFSDIKFRKLTPKLASSRQMTGDPALQRVNAYDISVLAQDVNGKGGASKPEVVALMSLGAVDVSEALRATIAATIREEMATYISTIVARETEIFLY